MANTNIVVGSNNFIPTDDGLEINIAAIHKVKGLKCKMINNLWKDIIDKHCLMTINNDDELCLPRTIAVAIA